MNNNYKISVLIACYNEEKYLSECFDSIYNQTYNNFEIIVVNDGSTDNTENIILDYVKKHKNIKYIHQDNHGQGYARNRALELASGDYVYFMDADDTIEKRTFELCVEKVKEKEYDFIFFEWKKLIDNKIKYDFLSKDIAHLNELIGDDCFILLKLRFYYTVNKLYNRDFLIKNNIKYGEGYIYEDHVFYTKTAVCAKKIGIIHSPLYNYRIHNESTTKAGFNSSRHYKGVINATKDKLNLNIKSNEALNYAINHSVNSFIWCYNNKTPKKHQKQFIVDFINVMKLYKSETYDGLNKISVEILTNLKYDKIKEILDKRKKKKFKRKKIIKTIQKKVKSLIYKFAVRLLPIKKKTILFMGFDFKYSGNSKYLFEQMNRKYPNNRYYFVTNDKNVPVKNRIKYRGIKYYYYYLTAKIIFYETWFFKNSRKRKGQIWIQSWHATTVKKLLFDSHEKYSSLKNHRHRLKKYKFINKWDYLITDTPNINKYFETAFLINEKKILPYGYPRVKYLIDNKNDEKTKNKLRKRLNIHNDKKTILYAPTWRDYNYDKNNQDYSYLLDLKKLKKLTKGKYNIIFRDHQYMNCFKSQNSDIINGMDIETQELLLISDYVISDYSSIVFDAMAINIPIIILAKDYQRYEKIRGVYKEIFEDLLYWEAKGEEEIVKMIESYKINQKYFDIKNKYCFDLKNYKTLEFINSLLKK